MGFFDQLFPKKEINQSKLWQNPIQVELHSHLIPGVDDGVETLEQAAETIQLFANMGYKKIITTPHIMSDFYKNGAHNLLPLLAELKTFISEKGINIELEVAAEYMVDEGLEQKIVQDDLLTFGGSKKYILLEMPFMSESPNLKKVLFELKIRGYQPIMAHPERYGYYHNQKDRYEEFFDQGILLQLNNLSLVGYYNPQVQKAAEYIIDKGYHSFLGSDAHNIKHATLMHNKVISSRLYKKACEKPLLNNTL